MGRRPRHPARHRVPVRPLAGCCGSGGRCTSAASWRGTAQDASRRYENGKTKPSLALVKLLRVLDRHPELLDEVRVA
ncbi:MAG TPA: type II toxin-antitoxin system MqsA family antitoxin [Burkholderiaceae bacterium]|nr:type II toxin-antitoxin system MqsA family antitoxin [Burkholderiaceae bacterium]